MKLDLSVAELIGSPYLNGICRVVAGEEGLSKPVSWVHVLEIRDVLKECVDGNEMVLTTGICWTNKEIAKNFIRELCEKNVSAICIETALYIHTIDQELIDIANEFGVVMLEITVISRFKDIVKGLNKMIIEDEYMSYINVDLYDRKLNELQTKATLEEGIKYTANYLNIEIAYLPRIGRMVSTTSVLQAEAKGIVKGLFNKPESEEVYCKGRIAIKNLNIDGRNYGMLLFRSNTKDITDFEIVVLGRLANKIKNDLVKEIASTEENLYKENSWISEWLAGHLNQEKICSNLKKYGYSTCFKEFCVCTFKYDDEIMFSDFVTDMTLFVRKIFEDKRLFVLGFIKENLIHYIIMNNESSEKITYKMYDVIKKMKSLDKTMINYANSPFSLGKVVHSSTDIKRSMETSMEFLDTPQLGGESLIVYDELYLDKIMFHIAGTPEINNYIEDCLGELLNEDNEELLHTLAVYFECNCSKQKTSERLYIVRQTLYFRLQKLEEILGSDFAEGERKAALEFACRAYMHKKKYNLT